MAPPMYGPRAPAKDYYQILGIDPTADLSVIRRARRILALKYHPDKTSGNADALAKFKEVQEAFETLHNPATRDTYDNARTSAEDVVDDAEVDSDVDQNIWDGWHASFTGRKGTSSSQTVWNTAQQPEPFSPSAGADIQDLSDGQRVYPTPLSPSREAAEATPKAQAAPTTSNPIWISSDEGDGGEEDQHETEPESEGADDSCAKDRSTTSTPIASHWTFYDYFDDEYNEKSLLPEMRARVADTRQQWRAACKGADTARVELKYAETPQDKVFLKNKYDNKCDSRDGWAKVRRIREDNVKKHEAIAKERMRTRKNQDKERARVQKNHEKEAEKANRKATHSTTRRSTRHQDRTVAAPLNAYKAFKTMKYGTMRIEPQESEDEWEADELWNP